ncbi:receptor-like protein EIX2 [Telopea speciosissima]|uniref:receptor-like protein EIX2 n=1 Tax=Telopea speciosissima TaxID=54955 RepID=UPI001CC7E57E|nr:receptor-like protein EIX2 [Telopea speciosissima]
MGGLSAITSIHDQFLLLLPLLLQLLLFDFLYLGISNNIVGAAGLTVSNNSSCKEGERQALLEFKAGLNDTTSGRLSSWIGDDCCTWRGVGCNNRTGHVIKLDLRNQPVYFVVERAFVVEYTEIDWEAAQKSSLGGKISPSLLKLKHLNYLDLSFNINFQGTHIPKFIGSLHNLRYLNLSFASFGGTIPPHFGNLSRLQYLDLHTPTPYFYFVEYELNINNPHWLSGLSSSLRYLNMKNVSFTGKSSTDWIQAVTMLPSLSELHLSFCELSNIPLSISSLPYAANFTSLLVLELAWNNFNSSIIPPWIFNITSLTVLDLSGADTEGRIPKTLGNLCNLKRLDLSYSNINGEITEYVNSLSICNSNSRLETLHLGYTEVSGLIPSSIGNLSFLIDLDLSSTQLSGPIPTSIGNLSSLIELDLSDTQLSGPIPTSIGNLSSLRTLDLSYNQKLDATIQSTVDLSFNQINGSLPLWSNVINLYLGTNLFTGQIPQNIGEVLGSGVASLDFSGNFLNGSIPSSICQLPSLLYLILSNNSLWGELPNCWKHIKGLTVLYLSNNNLSGRIPQSIGYLSSLEILLLSSSNFRGKLPSSLRKCTSISSLDLGTNGFTGNIPTWIGESVLALRLIRLHSNFFTEEIPSQICKLSGLHILDLSHNNLSRFIPQCLGNLSHLESTKARFTRYWHYEEHMKVVTKGRELEYTSTLVLVNSIDLSCNHLSGKIPDGITRLVGLGTLNLSMNHLTGKIPEKIGDLEYLETLDLSRNQLSGEIPPTISSLTFLSHLNLSHNNLYGKIPLSNQIQTISVDASIYSGNSGLCGWPLPNNCPGTNISPPSPLPPTNDDAKVDGDHQNEEWMDMLWFYIGGVMGFIVGFWAAVWVFHHAKGYRQLPMYYEADRIASTEDSTRWPGSSDDKLYQRKKQKSMAELLTGDFYVDHRRSESDVVGEVISGRGGRPLKTEEIKEVEPDEHGIFTLGKSEIGIQMHGDKVHSETI